MRKSQQKSSAFLICWNVYEASLANSVDPDQTAPIGAVYSGSTLFASIKKTSVMLGNYLQQTTSADNIFKCIFSARRGLMIVAHQPSIAMIMI